METGQRFSKKRQAIYDALFASREHPSAEWVYQTLKPEYPDLSLGTVYRNLTLFREQGLVRSVGVVDGHERFDADTSDHTHFVCTCCHALIDIPAITAGKAVEAQVGETYGFRVDHHDLTVYGTCAECMQKEIIS